MKYSYNFLFLSLLFAFWVVLPLNAQKGEEDMGLYSFVPPSPTAGGLGSFNQMGVGMQVGAAQANLPLLTLENPDLPLSVLLSYSSTGVKVDEIASWVGMGWQLQAGGVITRLIRDKPDEKDDFHPIPEDVNPNSVDLHQYLINTVNGDWDSEPDLYSFNFMGQSGKFIINSHKQLITLPYQNLHIEQEVAGDIIKFLIITPDGIKYTFGGHSATETSMNTTMQGPKDANPSSWYLVRAEHPSGAFLDFKYESDPGAVVHYVGVAQSYLRAGTSNCIGLVTGYDERPIVNTVRIEGKYLAEIISSCGRKVIFERESRQDVEGSRLVSITYSIDEEVIKEVNFKYLDVQADKGYKPGVTVDENAVKSRMFLEEVQVGRDKKFQLYNLEYYHPQKLPYRLSFAQDHWGYFNRARNSHFVPKVDLDLFDAIGGDRSPKSVNYGMLKSIVYPTGGKEIITYEPNTYFGEKKYIPDPVDEHLIVRGDPENLPQVVSTKEDFLITHRQEVTIAVSLEWGSGGQEPDQDVTKHAHGAINITNKDTGKNENGGYLKNTEFTIENTKQKKVWLDPGTYTFTLNVAGGDKVEANAKVHYTPPITIKMENIKTGGMRVKGITRNFLIGENSNTYYSYAKYNEDKSSAIPAVPPYYVSDYIKKLEVGDNVVDCKIYRLSSNSLTSQYFNNSPVLYQYVTVSYGPKEKFGCEEFEFEIASDTPGNPLNSGDNLADAPFSNHSWKSGRTRRHQVFSVINGNLEVIRDKEIRYQQVWDERLSSLQPAIYTHLRYDPRFVKDQPFICSKADTKRQYKGCKVNHTHIKLWVGPKETKCIAPGNNNDMIIAESPCFGREPGYEIEDYNRADHINAYLYYAISAWSYPVEEIMKEYDYLGEEKVERKMVTKFYHDNPKHSFLTRKVQHDSRGEQIVQQFYYPDDYDDNVDELKPLKDRFIIGKPVYTSQKVEEKTVKASIKLLNEYAKPEKVYQLNTNVPTDLSFSPSILVQEGFSEAVAFSYDEGQVIQVEQHAKPKVSYLRDSKKRVVGVVNNAGRKQIVYKSFEENGNISTSRLGEKGYKGTLFIEHPKEGIDYQLNYWGFDGKEWEFYSSLISSSTTIGSATTVVDEVTLLPVGASMQTFHYDANSRVAEASDSNQNRSFYFYDAVGRLDFVKDNKGNIIEKYDYQVVNQKIIP